MRSSTHRSYCRPANTLAGLMLVLLGLQTPESGAASLADAVTATLRLQQQEERVGALRGEQAAVERQAAGLVAADPALRAKTLSDALTGDDGAYEVEAMVDMPLWMPGQRAARRSLGQALGSQAGILTRYLRWEAAGRVRESAWAAAIAQGRLRQAGAALESARALERDIEKRSTAGELARVDLLVAKQDTLAREVDLQAAQNDYDKAIHAYIHLTGLPALPEPLLETSAPVEDEQALPSDHPVLASTAGAVAQARAERERTRSERRGNPILSLGAKQARGARGEPSDTALQLELSIPFGLASQSAPALAGAERALTERVAEQNLTRIEAEHTLHEARLGLLGAADALAVAERRQALTQDALRLVRRAFDLGESDLTALLQAQERARQSSLDLELRRLEQGRAAARLNQALGVVPE
ncbi:MAG: TolC family protein [Bdellovibrio bacteriovorus]